jgi:hypothetical protein
LAPKEEASSSRPRVEEVLLSDISKSRSRKVMPTQEDLSFFDPVLFIRDGKPKPVDTVRNPFLYNKKGHTSHLPAPRGKLIQPAEELPDVSMGRRYSDIRSRKKTINPGPYAYKITEFDFGVSEVHYEPLWATRETAQAFGMTLLRNGESVEFSYDMGLVSCQYTYGVFAGYQSPYIGKARRRELLAVNATDFEYHAFPHVFCSQDELPLVISVARYRPSRKEIWLADLWVRPGDCLYVPPKHYSDQYVDVHGNRNSARACWGHESKNSLVTHTTLGDDAVFSAEATKPHYHEEKHPTVHPAPGDFEMQHGHP